MAEDLDGRARELREGAEGARVRYWGWYLYWLGGFFRPLWGWMLGGGCVVGFVLPVGVYAVGERFGMGLGWVVGFLIFGFLVGLGVVLLLAWDRLGEGDEDRVAVRTEWLRRKEEAWLAARAEHEEYVSAAAVAERERVAREAERRARLEQLVAVEVRDLSGEQYAGYLAALFGELGFPVQRVGGARDQRVDLIVEMRGERWAVLSKRYNEGVDASVVQDVVLGARAQGCSRMMVVTTGFFADEAREAARVMGCVLVDRKGFPEAVRRRFVGVG